MSGAVIVYRGATVVVLVLCWWCKIGTYRGLNWNRHITGVWRLSNLNFSSLFWNGQQLIGMTPPFLRGFYINSVLYWATFNGHHTGNPSLFSSVITGKHSLANSKLSWL